MAVPV